MSISLRAMQFSPDNSDNEKEQRLTISIEAGFQEGLTQSYKRLHMTPYGAKV